MGRTAAGVRAIRLKKANDEVVGMDIIDQKPSKEAAILVVTDNGFGKKTNVNQYKKQNRGASGIKTAKITSKNGKIVQARYVDELDEGIILMSKKGQAIRVALKDISEHGRTTQGVRIMKMKAGDKLSALAVV